MPWQRRWPLYVSQRVLDDRKRASADLDQASDDLKDTIIKARRVHRVADNLAEARRRNHFSESMEMLFASSPPRHKHPPKDVA